MMSCDAHVIPEPGAGDATDKGRNGVAAQPDGRGGRHILQQRL